MCLSVILIACCHPLLWQQLPHLDKIEGQNLSHQPLGQGQHPVSQEEARWH
jgi:hypothetical protein